MKRRCILFFTFFFIHIAFSEDLESIIDSAVRYSNWPVAIEKLSDYLITNPDDSTAHALLGLSFFESGSFDPAVEQYLKAVDYAENDRKKSEYYYNAALAYYKADNKAASKDVLSKAVSLTPAMPQVYYMSGLLSFEENKTEAAVNEWKKYITYSKDTDKKNKVQEVIRRIEQAALLEKMRKEEEERRKQELLNLLQNQLDSKSDQTQSLQEYKINKDSDLEEEFELID